jgi:hypothetical protein
MMDTGPGTGGISRSACHSGKPTLGEAGSVRVRAHDRGGLSGRPSTGDDAGVTTQLLGSTCVVRPDPPNSYYEPEDELPPDYMEEWYDDPAY